MFSSRSSLAAVVLACNPADDAPPRRLAFSTSTVIAATIHPSSLSELLDTFEDHHLALEAFSNGVVIKLDQHGLPFQRAPVKAASSTTMPPTRATASPKRIPTAEQPIQHVTSLSVKATRAEIMNYLRKTNIFTRYALGSECSRRYSNGCSYVNGIIVGGDHAAINRATSGKDDSSCTLRPRRRIYALSEEEHDLLASMGSSSPGEDGTDLLGTEPANEERLVEADGKTGDRSKLGLDSLH